MASAGRARPEKEPRKAKPQVPSGALFVGAHDVSQKAWTRLRDPGYRKEMYEVAYKNDLKKYKGELSLVAANRILLERRPRGGARDQSDLIADYADLSAWAQFSYGETLPTVRLWFHFTGPSGQRYVIGGVPDGIAKEYCYEFKATSGSDDRLRENRKMAIRQALLYSHAFGRPSIKVQLVRLKLPGPFPFEVRALPEAQVLPAIEREADPREIAGILEGLDSALSQPTPAYPSKVSRV